MSKILKNTTVSDIFVADVGINLIAASSYTVPAQDYMLWAASSNVIVYIGNGSVVVNDGTYDLSPAQGVGYIQGSFIQRDFIPSLKNNDRLKVEVISTGGAPNVQVSSNDQTSGYLEEKIVAVSGETTVTTLNDGGDEDLQVGLANAGTPGTYGSAAQTLVLTTDSKGRVTSVTNTPVAIPSTQVTDFIEATQDAVGSALADTSSVDLSYNDVGNAITATVLPAGVDHNSLANLTSGDPHTQYVNRETNATVTDNAITRWDGTTGRDIQNSLASVDDNGAIISPTHIRVGDTSDTTNGNIRLNSGDLEGRVGGQWVSLTKNDIIYNRVSRTTSISTTSTNYVVMTSMTLTPPAGTYLVDGRSTVTATSNNRTVSMAIYSDGVIVSGSQTESFIRTGSGFLTNTDIESLVNDAVVTVNGSQAVDLRWKTTGGTVQANFISLRLIKVSS